MLEAFLVVCGVQTRIIAWGVATTEDLLGCEELVLVIPGNPGVVGYYKEFMEVIYSNLKIPICAVSHAGCDEPEGNSKEPYDLHFQVSHKADFINTYMSKGVRLYLIGHSIGCKMILDLLKNEDVNMRTKKCYLLFPTIERMAESPNGKFLVNLVLPITPIILLLSSLFTFFPTMLQKGLVYLYFLVRRSGSSAVEVTTQLINPYILENVFLLARDEMINVKELDHDTIESFKEKLFLYYGATDGWAPVCYFEDLKKSHPNVHAELCHNNFEHAFVLSSSKQMGMYVSDLIKKEIK